MSNAIKSFDGEKLFHMCSFDVFKSIAINRFGILQFRLALPYNYLTEVYSTFFSVTEYSCKIATLIIITIASKIYDNYQQWPINRRKDVNKKIATVKSKQSHAFSNNFIRNKEELKSGNLFE